MSQILRQHAEQQFAEELHELKQADTRERPENWTLSPWAVASYLMGDKLANGYQVSAKYIGNRRLIETAVATLATDRALLLFGVPGTAKSWVSEHLAAAISGDSTMLIQGTAGTSEEQMRYGWNYAHLLAKGPSKEALVPSPLMRAMELGKIARVEELTRIPADVQDTLITLLSEKSLPVPELGIATQAVRGFNVIATANNRDKGVNELSSALKRRFNTVVLPVPATADEEVAIVSKRVSEMGRALHLPGQPPALKEVRRVVQIFRDYGYRRSRNQDDLDRANARALKAEQHAKVAGLEANKVLDAAAKMRIDARVVHEQAVKLVKDSAKKQAAKGLITSASTAEEMLAHFGVPDSSSSGPNVKSPPPRNKPAQCDYYERSEGDRLFVINVCYELPAGGGDVVRERRTLVADTDMDGLSAPRVVITGGGGDFPGTLDFYNLTIEACANCRAEIPNLSSVVVAGPLFKDWSRLRLNGSRLLPFHWDMPGLYDHANLIVCQAGYNTVAEVLRSGKPTISIPGERPLDDHLGPGEPAKLLPGPVERGDHPPVVDGDDGIHDRIEDRAQALLALAPCRLGILAGGDVHAEFHARVAAKRTAGKHEPLPRAVLANAGGFRLGDAGEPRLRGVFAEHVDDVIAAVFRHRRAVGVGHRVVVDVGDRHVDGSRRARAAAVFHRVEERVGAEERAVGRVQNGRVVDVGQPRRAARIDDRIEHSAGRRLHD